MTTSVCLPPTGNVNASITTIYLPIHLSLPQCCMQQRHNVILSEYKGFSLKPKGLAKIIVTATTRMWRTGEMDEINAYPNLKLVLDFVLHKYYAAACLNAKFTRTRTARTGKVFLTK